MSGQFGRYRIEDEESDRGFTGRVYRAYDPNLSQYVAIKMLSAAPDLLRRLEYEGAAIVGLKHENIARVFDFGEQDGVPYLVMELLRGETLDPILKSGVFGGTTLQLPDKVNILLQVAKGLQYAHSVNVIHGDIRPGNVLVLPNKTVKILDFGIARALDKAGDADRQTDVAAYAGLGYRLIAGTHPFAGGGSGIGIDNIAPAAPAPIYSIVPECPEALDTLILRLLAKDPELPPDSLEDAIRDLETILRRLQVERAAEMAGKISSLVEAGETKSARETIAAVLDLDPVNAEGRIWREYLAAIEDTEAALSDAASAMRRDAEERARLALERFSARRRQATSAQGEAGGEPAPGVTAGATGQGDDRKAGVAQKTLARHSAVETETRLDPGPSRAGWSAEDRARMALARHSARTTVAHAGPAAGEGPRSSIPAPDARNQPIPSRRDRSVLWACASGILCLTLLYIAWSLRPVRIVPVPRQLEFHQAYGRLPEALRVEWAVPDLAFDVSAKPDWLLVSRTRSGVRVSVTQANLSPGLHPGAVRIDFRSIRIVNPRISIPVRLAVTISADPAYLTFRYRRDGPSPGPQSVTVAGAANVTPTTDPNTKWLRADARRARDNPTVRIWVEPRALGTGDYHAEVRLKDENGFECRVTVSLVVTEATAATAAAGNR
jgi:hypothetical protein